MGKGYVSVHREIMDHWLWEEKPFSKGQAWIDLILQAKYKDEKFLYKGTLVDGKRGTVYRSVKSLAERWGWNRETATKFLNLLEADGMIAQNKTKHHTTITLLNYGRFQDLPTTKQATQHASKRTKPRQPSDNRTNIYNKDNKENKENKNNKKDFSEIEDQEGQTPEDIAAATEWFNSLQEE